MVDVQDVVLNSDVLSHPGGLLSSSLKTRSLSFWCCSSQFINSSFLIVPNHLRLIDSQPLSPQEESHQEVSQYWCQLAIYDSSGEKINQVKIEYQKSSASLIELDQFLGGCKLESGLKHAHVLVTVPENVHVISRVNSSESATLVGEAVLLTSPRVTFFPLAFAEDRKNFLCMVNRSKEEAVLKGRLFLGSRSPEGTWSIPPFASRVVLLESEFKYYTSSTQQNSGAELQESREILLQGYLRLTTRSGDAAVQMIEMTQGPRDNGFFTSVS